MKLTRSAGFSVRSVSSASRRTSGACAATCMFGPTITSRTRPRNGAVSEDSIFMLSTTATTSPAFTSSPGLTGTDTTTAGARLRTMPPASREMRCGTPSTSISRSSPCREVTVRYTSPATSIRRSWLEIRSSRASIDAPSTTSR